MDIVEVKNNSIKINNVKCSIELKTVKIYGDDSELCYLNLGGMSYPIGLDTTFNYFLKLRKGGKI